MSNEQKLMLRAEKVYVGLCSFFCVLIVLSNLIYQKFVALPLFPFYTFELSAGAIVYPFTFLMSDLITECFGKEKAQFCVRFGIMMNMIVVSIIGLIDSLPATSWSKIDNAAFHDVFGMYGFAFISSMVACYTAQVIDIRIYLWIRKITKSRYLWLRNIVSTASSLLIDTCIVITLLTFFGVLPKEHLGSLIVNSYSFKLFFTICSTPLFYLGVTLVQWLMKRSFTDVRIVAPRTRTL